MIKAAAVAGLLVQMELVQTDQMPLTLMEAMEVQEIMVQEEAVETEEVVVMEPMV
jgi:hypothetical protein